MISVVIPTCARRTLEATVRSSLWADEIVVVPERVGDVWGNGQRDRGIAAATGAWICFMDDDDVFVPDVSKILRSGDLDSGAWHVFRMQDKRSDSVVWNEPVIRYGNVGTPMLVVPNVDTLPRWSANNVCEADYFFAEACRKTFGEPTFHEDVIAHLRPHEESATT